MNMSLGVYMYVCVYMHIANISSSFPLITLSCNIRCVYIIKFKFQDIKEKSEHHTRTLHLLLGQGVVHFQYKQGKCITIGRTMTVLLALFRY